MNIHTVIAAFKSLSCLYIRHVGVVFEERDGVRERKLSEGKRALEGKGERTRERKREEDNDSEIEKGKEG